jgi:hypothetical protein
MLYRWMMVLLVGMSIASCGSKKDQENDLNDGSEVIAPDTAKVTVNDTTKFKFDFAMANIPSPATSIQELEGLGVPYDKGMLNPTENVSKYSNEFKKAINLGVYNIDMAYAMMNDKGQDVLQYMKSVMMLADELGLKNAVGSMVGSRAESNLARKDSLFKILDEIFSKSDSYLRTNDRLYTAAIIFAGSWLESLYLNCKISSRATEQKSVEKARRVLWEQRFHLGNLTKVLQDYKSRPEDKELLEHLHRILDKLMVVKQSSDLDDEKFKSIAGDITALRDKVTN